MMIKRICFVLLATLMQSSNSKTCESKTESGEIIKICCTDYEEKGNKCIPCSTGYTSEKGQNCTSCPKNTYGERCKYDCSCSGFEICDNVKGCVGFPLTTDTSVYATPYIMTLPWDINVITNGEKSDNSIEGGSQRNGNGEYTSSFDDGLYEINQDYLNKPVIKISPPNIKDYTTQATVHTVERSVPDNKRDSPCKHEYRPQKINVPKKDALRLQYEYDIALMNGRFTVPKRCLSNITKRVSQSCNNLKIECIKSNMFTGNNGKSINSTDDNMLDFHNMIKARSESNIV
ncbi:unnamed protein product [Mytilus coruscus]|uniref:MEGF10_11 n=1 Tax=Mytilus coruscus TaxID=42192 RepID=A0A6J8B2E3_MYTCO|nr:unnamed protein product [Mytilus coruscus]